MLVFLLMTSWLSSVTVYLQHMSLSSRTSLEAAAAARTPPWLVALLAPAIGKSSGSNWWPCSPLGNVLSTLFAAIRCRVRAFWAINFFVRIFCVEYNLLCTFYTYTLWAIKLADTTFWTMKLLIEHSKWGAHRSFTFLKIDSQLLETSIQTPPPSFLINLFLWANAKTFQTHH
jgi:hypothetical protein